MVELVEVMVPFVFVANWVLLYASPQSAHFAGLRSDNYGFFAPKSFEQYVFNVGLWVVVELTSIALLHCFLLKWLQLSLVHELQVVSAKFGTMIAMQTWLVVTYGFCARMLNCGFDVSFKFSWL